MPSAVEMEFSETGRRLGYDLYNNRAQFEAADLPPSVREGVEHARATARPNARPDRYVRKWLQLRLGAFRRGRAFDEAVTPALLCHIDVPECPVTRIALTHGERCETDWSVDRLNNDGAYAANNLAVMSSRANQAKGNKSFSEVLALSERQTATNGLEPVEWKRLAAMMLGPCFATAPARAPVLAEIVPVMPHRLLLGTQHVQHVLCSNARTSAGKNALIKAFRSSARTERCQVRLRKLVEVVHQTLKSTERSCDIWLEDAPMAALKAWRLSLDEASWAIAAEVSRQLAGASTLPSSLLLSWHMDQRGYSAQAVGR